MRAAIYKGEQVLQVEEIPDPVPGPGQAVMKVKYAAICGTDVHAFMYDLAQPGTVMGHEFAGSIVDVGEGVTRWKSGDRVSVEVGTLRRVWCQGRGPVPGSITGQWGSSTMPASLVTLNTS